MAAPAFVAGTELDGNISSGGTVSWAAGGASDIIVVAYGCYQYSAATGTPTMSGFTAFGVRAGINSSQFEASTGILLKAAGTTSSGSATLTLPNANSGQIDWISVRIAGGDTTTLAEAASGAGGNNTSPTAPTLTSGGTDRLELIANFLNQAVTTPYSGFTNFAQWSGSSAEGIWSKTITASGATGAFAAATTGPNGGWGLSNLLIPPAAAGSTAAITLADATAAADGAVVNPSAVAYVKEVGFVTNSTAGTTSAITVAAGGVPVGDTIVIYGACDNTGASGIATTIAAADNHAGTTNVYTLQTPQAIADPGAAAAGIQGFFVVCQVTTALSAGDTITITYGNSTTAKAINAQQFTGANTSAPVLSGSYATTNNQTTTASSVAATASAANQAVCALVAVEGGTADSFTQDADTTNGSWVTLTRRGSGTTTAGATLNSVYKIVTASGTQTYNPTLGTARDSATAILILDPQPSPVSGSGTVTLTDATVAATGSSGTTITGTAAVTLAAATVAAAGTQKIAGPAPVVLADATAAASGTERISGTAAVTLAAATVSAIGGGATVTGTAAVVLADATASAAGTERISGSAPVVLAAATVTATGGGAIIGTAAVTLAAATVAATGTETATWRPFDDFPGTTIDYAQWDVYDRLADQVNNEVNAVIPANVRVSSGTLKIDSKFEDVVSGDTTTGPPNPRTVHYTSGQIAQRSAAFLYGDIQVRAKLPGGIGLWPCIWMLGYQWQASQPFTANVAGHNWPNGGWWEIDIAEFMFDHRTQVNNALHFVTANRAGSGEKALPFNATSRFMVYRLVWTATSLTWMVDAEDGVGWRTTLTITGTAGTDIPNTAGYLIIHTAIGGNATNTPDSSTFPQTFEVDWARVTTGTGSGTVTLADATAAASGTERISGSAAVALGAATTAGVGTERITGSAALTLAAATANATGAPKYAGTAAVTLTDATAAAAGTQRIVGAGTITLGDATAAAVGLERISGAAAVVLSAATAAGVGSGAAVTGSAAVTLGDATAAASGTERISGGAAIVLGDATAAGAGTERIVGAAPVALAAATVAAAGTSSNNTGSGTITLGDATAAAAGLERITGTAVVTLAPAAVDVGAVEKYVGAVAVLLTAAAVTAAGSISTGGGGTTTLAPVTVTAIGTLRIIGAAAVLLANAAVVAEQLGAEIPGRSTGTFGAPRTSGSLVAAGTSGTMDP